MDPFELTRQLMTIPSVSGTEKEVGLFLSSFLQDIGYKIEIQAVTDDRFNVIAYAGDPKIIFCTHIDTVPPYLPVSEDETTLYGRGACDTKGIIAAMIEAGNRLKSDGVSNFAYVFVVGEEAGGVGAKAANTLDWNSDYVIVGEPTENKLAKAHKGTLQANLQIQGKAAHSGYPEAGISAVELLIEVLHDCVHADWGIDPVLGVGTFNAGVVKAGEGANIVPAEAETAVMLRTVEPSTEAEKRLFDLVNNRAKITINSESSPQHMFTLDGFEQTVVSFGTDVPYLNNLGKPILIGPGSILDAHTMNEKILKVDLLKGISLYVDLVHRLEAETNP